MVKSHEQIPELIINNHWSVPDYIPHILDAESHYSIYMTICSSTGGCETQPLLNGPDLPCPSLIVAPWPPPIALPAPRCAQQQGPQPHPKGNDTMPYKCLLELAKPFWAFPGSKTMSFSLYLIFKKLCFLLPVPFHPSHLVNPKSGFPNALPQRICEIEGSSR